MKLNLVHKLALSALSATLILYLTSPIFASVSYTMLWKNDVALKLSTHNSVLRFTENYYLNSLTFNSGNSLTLTDINMNGHIDTLTLSSTENINITSLSDTQLTYTVTTSGNQTVNLENKTPATVTVDGTTTTDYTHADGTTTITTATSNATLTYSTDTIIGIAQGHGSRTGLIFLAFVAAISMLGYIMLKRRNNS